MHEKDFKRWTAAVSLEHEQQDCAEPLPNTVHEIQRAANPFILQKSLTLSSRTMSLKSFPDNKVLKLFPSNDSYYSLLPKQIEALHTKTNDGFGYTDTEGRDDDFVMNLWKWLTAEREVIAKRVAGDCLVLADYDQIYKCFGSDELGGWGRYGLWMSVEQEPRPETPVAETQWFDVETSFIWHKG